MDAIFRQVPYSLSFLLICTGFRTYLPLKTRYSTFRPSFYLFLISVTHNLLAVHLFQKIYILFITGSNPQGTLVKQIMRDLPLQLTDIWSLDIFGTSDASISVFLLFHELKGIIFISLTLPTLLIYDSCDLRSLHPFDCLFICNSYLSLVSLFTSFIFSFSLRLMEGP